MVARNTVSRTVPVILGVGMGENVLSMIYAHGHLERWLSHDIITTHDKLQLEPGIHPVVARQNGEKRSAIAFVWNHPRINRSCGLVVQKDDVESLRFAAEKFAQQSEL